MLTRPNRIHPLAVNRRSPPSRTRSSPLASPTRVAATMATTGVSAFLSQHDLQAKIEDALNRCVKNKPDEPLSFLVRLRLVGFWR